VAVVGVSGNGCVQTINCRLNHQRDYAKRVDIVIVAVIKSLRFVPKPDDARADWRSFGLDINNGIGKPSTFVEG